MRYEYIFFDLDRTLWDYDANALEALTMVFTEYNLDLYFESPKEFYDIYTRKNDQLWDDYRNGIVRKEELRSLRFFQTLVEKGISDEKLSALIGDRYMYLIPRLNMLLPNTIPLLKYLQEKKYQMYIITNGFIRTQNRKMANSSIDHFFLKVFSSEELGVNKPSKEIFHWAISSIHAKKNKCLMVGDDFKVDIKGAMSYGIDAAWFNPSDKKYDFEPSYMIKDLLELQDIL